MSSNKDRRMVVLRRSCPPPGFRKYIPHYAEMGESGPINLPQGTEAFESICNGKSRVYYPNWNAAYTAACCLQASHEKLRQDGALYFFVVRWYGPEEIKDYPEYHSDAMCMIPLLLAFEGEGHPVKGYYVGTLLQWRQDGSPSSWNPTAWMPLPEMPERMSREMEGI